MMKKKDVIIEGIEGEGVEVIYAPVSPLRISPVKKMTTHLIYFFLRRYGQYSENCQL